MTRLAVAKTLVQGTVTLQGISYSFSASASGKGVADKAFEAKRLAVVASNSAATLAARASIEQILSENSAVLSDLEITESISNNLTTTVKLFKQIALSSIATTKDGINYIISKKTTIAAGQWLIVPRGLNLTVDAPFTNYGYVQFGSGEKPVGEATSTYTISSTVNNYFIIQYDSCIVNVYAVWNNWSYKDTSGVSRPAGIQNSATFTLRNASGYLGTGYMNNNFAGAGIDNCVGPDSGSAAYFKIESNASVNNNVSGEYSVINGNITNGRLSNAVVCNNGRITGPGSVYNYTDQYGASASWLGTGYCNSPGAPPSMGTC